jgi:hypothetical protein
MQNTKLISLDRNEIYSRMVSTKYYIGLIDSYKSLVKLFTWSGLKKISLKL